MTYSILITKRCIWLWIIIWEYLFPLFWLYKWELFI